MCALAPVVRGTPNTRSSPPSTRIAKFPTQHRPIDSGRLENLLTSLPCVSFHPAPTPATSPKAHLNESIFGLLRASPPPGLWGRDRACNLCTTCPGSTRSRCLADLHPSSRPAKWPHPSPSALSVQPYPDCAKSE